MPEYGLTKMSLGSQSTVVTVSNQILTVRIVECPSLEQVRKSFGVTLSSSASVEKLLANLRGIFLMF